MLCLDRVTVVDEGDVTTEDVRRTGMSPDELRASMAGEGTLLRIELRLAGDDPRIALRERLPEHAASSLHQSGVRRCAGYDPPQHMALDPETRVGVYEITPGLL